MLKLTPMTKSDYEIWSPRSRAGYAADKMRANRLTKEEADKISEEDFQRLLPQGLETPDNYLFAAKDANGERVGFIWFMALGAEGNRRAYICDIIVELEHRGKGYGKQMMIAIEGEAKKLSLNRIGLHVFGFNEVAVNLYQSLGYQTTDLIMEKKL